MVSALTKAPFFLSIKAKYILLEDQIVVREVIKKIKHKLVFR